MEGDCHGGQRLTTWSWWKEGFKPSDVHCQVSAICGEKAPARSSVFNWAWNFDSGKETAGGCP
jgi:hypothetical protein